MSTQFAFQISGDANVMFQTSSNGAFRFAVQTSGNGDMKSVIYNIYGKDIAEGILDVEYEYEGIKLKGVVGKPEIARSNKSNQMFFVNKRYVKDKTLSAAADKAFKGMLPIGKFAFLVLNIDMDPKKVDVNVHPTKLEVRFQEDGKVFKAIYNSIKQALLKYDLVPSPEKEYKNTTPNDILKSINDISSNLFSTKIENSSINTIENNKIEKIDPNEEKESSDSIKNEIPKYSEFKSTMNGLDSDTRKRFIDELTQTKDPEEIGKKLADMTKALANNKEISDTYKENKNEEENQKIDKKKIKTMKRQIMS